MVAFGFMDNTVMLHAGNAIDATLGVTFGLSTLAAAACGQICSDMAGVSFGGIIEAMAARLGLPAAGLTEAQMSSGLVKRVGLVGALLGVFCGCSLGLLNLFIIDTNHVRELKLAAQSSAYGFSVAMSNAERDGVTAIRIEGPQNVEGVVAAATTAIAAAGGRIKDMSGHREGESSSDQGTLHLTFYITVAGEQVEDDELESMARSIMASCNNPERYQRLATEIEELKQENQRLQSKLQAAEAAIERHLLRVKRKDGQGSSEQLTFGE